MWMEQSVEIVSGRYTELKYISFHTQYVFISFHIKFPQKFNCALF